MNNIRHFFHTIILVVVSFLFTACFDESKPISMPAPETVHTLIALDLSDRIHNPQTVENDIAVIKELFAEFQQQCREAMFVDATSSFSMLLIPQQGDEHLLPLMDSLSIDLGQIDDLKKRKAVENFAAKLDGRLKILYSNAIKPTLQEYNGACMFRCLSTLPARLDCHQGEKTKLYLISDGLIEVDSPEARLEMDGRRNYITDAQMSKLRKDNAWQHSDLRLLVVPTNLAKRDNSQFSVCLVGLQGRREYALEQDLLSAIWSTWMNEMNISNFTSVSYDAERSFILSQIRQKSQ